MFYPRLLLTTFLLFDSYKTQTLSNCESKETCSQCIQELNCVWCISPVTLQNLTINHCTHKDAVTKDWCDDQFVINPESSYRILQNKPLISLDDGQAVQIKPQTVQLTLRKGEEFNLEFQYAQAENYPVDLYYIMDLSASMVQHKEKLAKLGQKLVDTMINITNNFRLGFGSFVDKVDLPFTSTVPAKWEYPCNPSTQVDCVSPYSFKNHLSLSHDYSRFTVEVSKAPVSGNMDAPEGGFDALMQAIVCKKDIGWRDQARHLLVFSTDALFHIAGDGKLAGVVEPNDATCHMVKDLYVDSLKYDYPSISHINYVARENNINIIFAIVKESDHVKSYEKLSAVVENSNVGSLDGKSENVINLIMDNYNKIVDSVTIATNASTDVEVKISSNCPQPIESGCTNIHVGEVVNFTATIKPLECTAGSNRKTITIKPDGLSEEIVIELEVLCDCDCESSSSQHFVKSEQCSKSGDLKCGVCDCDPGRFGSNCECDKLTSDSEDVRNCKATESDTEICSNLGTCKCGKCECNKRDNPQEKIYGKLCQCDNYSCSRKNGVLCSNRGVCDCGQCKCYAGWTGDTCECPDSKSSCIRPGSGGSVCSGQGTCKCGECDCNTGSYRISGKYCEECLTCPGQRCDELRDCVECQAYKSGLYNEEDCRIKCTTFTTEIVNQIDQENVEDEVKICRMGDQQGCTFIFQYEYLQSRELVVKAAKDKVCVAALNPLVWIFSVIGTIILAGIIALIIWKVCTTIHDQREYAKFDNERNNLRWHRSDNPLYKQATTTFANPSYNMYT